MCSGILYKTENNLGVVVSFGWIINVRWLDFWYSLFLVCIRKKVRCCSKLENICIHLPVNTIHNKHTCLWNEIDIVDLHVAHPFQNIPVNVGQLFATVSNELIIDTYILTYCINSKRVHLITGNELSGMEKFIHVLIEKWDTPTQKWRLIKILYKTRCL